MSQFEVDLGRVNEILRGRLTTETDNNILLNAALGQLSDEKEQLEATIAQLEAEVKRLTAESGRHDGVPEPESP